MPLRFRKAILSDAEVVVRMYRAAVSAMEERDILQLDDIYPD